MESEITDLSLSLSHLYFLDENNVVYNYQNDFLTQLDLEALKVAPAPMGDLIAYIDMSNILHYSNDSLATSTQLSDEEMEDVAMNVFGDIVVLTTEGALKAYNHTEDEFTEIALPEGVTGTSIAMSSAGYPWVVLDSGSLIFYDHDTEYWYRAEDFF